jgi:hypothetical protein
MGGEQRERWVTSEQKAMKSKPTRIHADKEVGVGFKRYSLLCAAAVRIRQSLDNDYPLEATTLVESILADRMEKRAQYLHKQAQTPAKALMNVSDGFVTLGNLVTALQTAEIDEKLREHLDEISDWARERNRVIHAMAKFGEGARDAWEVRHRDAKQVAERGIAILLTYDRHERRVSHSVQQRTFASATCPDALEPIGQTSCEWCDDAGEIYDEYVELE